MYLYACHLALKGLPYHDFAAYVRYQNWILGIGSKESPPNKPLIVPKGVPRASDLHLYLYSYLHLCPCLYLYLRLNLHLHLYLYMYIYMYIYIYIYLHIYVYTYTYIALSLILGLLGSLRRYQVLVSGHGHPDGLCGFGRQAARPLTGRRLEEAGRPGLSKGSPANYQGPKRP